MVEKKKLQQIKNLAEKERIKKEETTKKCPICGKEINIISVFCTNCGHIFIE